MAKDQNLGLGIFGIAIGLAGIGIGCFAISYALVQPTDFFTKSVLALGFSVGGIFAMYLAFKFMKSASKYKFKF